MRAIDFPGRLFYFLHRFLFSFGEYADTVWLVSCLLFFLTLLALSSPRIIRPAAEKNNPLRRAIKSPVVFSLCVAAGIILLRMPTLLRHEQNPDESTWISGAATLLRDMRFWISTEGGTSGPLVMYPLTLLGLIGVKMNYASVRLFDLVVCIVPSILLMYFALRKFFSDWAARLAVLPAALCMAFAYTNDMVFYESEHIPMLLIALSIFLYSLLASGSRRRPLLLASLGFILGCFPYSKLQAAPIAAAIALFVSAELLFQKDRKGIAIFLPSLAVPTALVLAYALLSGAYEHFVKSFIMTNLGYAGRYDTVSVIERLGMPVKLIYGTEDMKMYFFSTLLFSCGGIIYFLLRRSRPMRPALLALATLVLLAGYYALYKPARAFPHYQMLFVLPATFFAGVVIGAADEHLSASSKAGWKRLAMALVLAALVLQVTYTISARSKDKAGLMFSHIYSSPYRANDVPIIFDKGSAVNIKETTLLQKNPVASAITSIAAPEDSMVVWGFLGSLHVETGLPQGTMYSTPAIVMNDESLQFYKLTPELHYYHIRRYVKDMLTNKPRIFVDVAGADYKYITPQYMHEKYPFINDIIRENYYLAYSNFKIRIYVRNDQK